MAATRTPTPDAQGWAVGSGPPPPRPRPLRFVTYLTPGLPVGLFEALAGHIAGRLGRRSWLCVETRRSGPAPGGADPFSTGEVDVGFLCAPSFLWLADRRPPAVRLVPAAAVFTDPRGDGRPVYFSEVLVAAHHDAASVEELRDVRWAYNDPYSLSGYHAIRGRLGPAAARFTMSGSHDASLEMLLAGQVDACAVDANVLALRCRTDATLAARLRRVETLGPYPVQPVVVGARAEPGLAEAVARILLTIHIEPACRQALEAAGVERFAVTDETLYEEQRAVIALG